MNTIEVPAYVEQDFCRRLGPVISGKPDAAEQSVLRVYRLVAHALKGLEHVDWVIDGHESYRSRRVVQPYGLERFKDCFIVYAEERGSRGVLAIFKQPDLAGEYFVWVVSRGERKIDWQLFLEMEP